MTKKGFTLIELLIVIGIIAVLAGVVIVALNPARQFAQARDTQRTSNVNTILNAIGQRMADTRGDFAAAGPGGDPAACAAGAIPTDGDPGTAGDQPENIGSGAGNYDLAPCIVPVYTSVMPLDPQGGTAADTGYDVQRDAASGRITVSAPNTEIGPDITLTR